MSPRKQGHRESGGGRLVLLPTKLAVDILLMTDRALVVTKGAAVKWMEPAIEEGLRVHATIRFADRATELKNRRLDVPRETLQLCSKGSRKAWRPVRDSPRSSSRSDRRSDLSSRNTSLSTKRMWRAYTYALECTPTRDSWDHRSLSNRLDDLSEQANDEDKRLADG